MVIGCSDGHLPWPTSSMSSPPPVSPCPLLIALAVLSNYMLKRKQPKGTSRQLDLLQVQTVEQNTLCASGMLMWTHYTNINSYIYLPIHPPTSPSISENPSVL